MHDQNQRRRSSNDDEGVEEDFSSSGSGIETNPSTTHCTHNKDFEELTQIMKNSLVAYDNSTVLQSVATGSVKDLYQAQPN